MRGSTKVAQCIAAAEAAGDHGRRPRIIVGERDLNSTTARILLVDDEQPVQKLLSYPLEKDGYEVVPALDGQEALHEFDRQRFDLVVLDIMLPKIDGLEVCR